MLWNEARFFVFVFPARLDWREGVARCQVSKEGEFQVLKDEIALGTLEWSNPCRWSPPNLPVDLLVRMWHKQWDLTRTHATYLEVPNQYLPKY